MLTKGAGRQFCHLHLIGPLPRTRFLLCVGLKTCKEGAQARSPAAEPRLSERATFFYAMSIAKRIWPAILIDSKFSTKLHGIGLSPRYFEIEKKDSFWSTARKLHLV